MVGTAAGENWAFQGDFLVFVLFQVLQAAAGVLHPAAVRAAHALQQLQHPETPQEAGQEKDGRLEKQPEKPTQSICWHSWTAAGEGWG